MAEKRKKTTDTADDQFKWPFGKKNYLYFGLALIVIIIGYIALWQGSITLAPILLVIGYCVLIPVAIIVRGRSEDDDSNVQRLE